MPSSYRLRSTLVLGLLFLLLMGSQAQQANVRLSPEVKGKYPRLQRVLDGILQTVEDPSLFSPKIWNGKIRFTGKVTNVVFSDVMREYRKYLTDGRLQIDLRPDPDAKRLRFRAAAQVVDEEHMLLFYMAGSQVKNGKAYYSDYQLAQTIFHELIHVYQLRTGNVGFDKEAPAYYVEGTLPVKHFDTRLYPDPVDETSPVAGPTPMALPIKVGAVVAPTLVLTPGKPGETALGGTPVEGVVQFSLQGLPEHEQRAIHFKAILNGPDKFSMPISRNLVARGSHYQADSFQVELPLRAPAGTYRCDGLLTIDGVSEPVEGSFGLAYPELTMNFHGPARRSAGQSVSASVVLQGSPPFRWEWSSSSGEQGSGNGSGFTIEVPKMPTDTLYFTVRAWDSRSKQPTVRTFLVDTDLPRLDVEINGPAEACVGRPVLLMAGTRGGSGAPVSYRWSFPGGAESTSSASFTPDQPGTVQVSVVAHEAQRLYSAPAVHRITVFPALKASVSAPTEAPIGQQITLSARVQGGKTPYQYLWTNPVGQTSGKQTVRSTLDGKVGDQRTFTLQVRDSLDPPQEVKTSHTVQLGTGPEIKTGPLRVSPATAEPGKVVKVEIDFTLVNFPPGVHQCTVHFWLEGLPGTGSGKRQTQQHSFAGKPLHVVQNFGIDKRTKPGTLRAQVKILAGDQEVLRRGSVQVARPGGLQDVTVDSRSLRLKIWDHGSEDGDVVSIYLNGNKVAGPGKITKKGAVVSLNLRSGSNELVVYAHNEGDTSPNTASIQLTNVVQGPSSQSYSLKKNEKGRFFIVAP